MFTLRQYVKVESLKEAYELNQKRANLVIGGMGWIKMNNNDFGAAIDLSKLGLDGIEEKDDEFVIGAMVTLRQLETNCELNAYFSNAFKECMRHIVGVQFRNCATIGGTLWLRPGFSDPVTLLMALDTYVEIYDGSDENKIIAVEEFCKMEKDNSILCAVHIKKSERRLYYTSFRNTQTDLPSLTLALSKADNTYIAAVGARPSLAEKITAESMDELINKALELDYKDNMYGSAEYRKNLAKVLIKEAFEKIDNTGRILASNTVEA